MPSPSLVTTKTPLRIGFAGGGTDLPAFYEREEGAVLNSTIDKYLYVTVKRHNRLFLENYRLNYSETEHVDSLEDIKNSIARESLRFVGIEPPLYIGTIADLPGSSGLGSSSSFTVGLLNALHTFKGDSVSAAQLAEEACHIEINVLKKPIGKQDQYAAAFGGLNHFFFCPSGEVVLSPKHLPEKKIERLFDSLMLFWTGISRSADPILLEQQVSTESKMDELREMKRQSHEIWSLMEKDCPLKEIGGVLQEGWENKRRLTSKISNPQFDSWYDAAIQAGAHGGKLLGAGGGGFLLFVVPEEKRDAVISVLRELTLIRVKYESRGSQVVHLQRE